MTAARSTARAASTVPGPAPGVTVPGPAPGVTVPGPAPGVTVPGPAPGVPARSVSAPVAALLPVSARVTWGTVRCGNLDKMRAATPATMPLAVLVELIGA